MNPIESLARARWHLLLAGILGAFALQSATAADKSTPASPPAKAAAKPAKPTKAREGSLGGGSASGPMLTKDELRQCIAEQDRLKKETGEVVATQQKLAKDRAELERVSAEIDADKPKVDLSNKEAVDAFNARLQAKGKLVTDYQAAASHFNDRVDKLDADDKAFTKNCKDRRYFEDEYDEIKAGK